LNGYDDSADNNGTTITPTNGAAGTCSYDGAITLPTNTMTKTGYEFAGWRVKPLFDLSSLFGTNDICTNADSSYARATHNNKEVCYAYGTNTVNSSSIEVCTNESNLSDVEMYQWKTKFSYGTIKGEARCSTQHPTTFWYNNNYTFTSDHFATTITDETGQAGAQYCWCKATDFARPNNSSYREVASSSWVFQFLDSTYKCGANCAFRCAEIVRTDSRYRGALFGVTGGDMCN
jgi:hypothetical protein